MPFLSSMSLTTMAIVALAVLGVVSVALDYYREDERDLEEAARSTGERAEKVTQSAARGSRLAVVGLAGLGMTVAMEMLQFAADLNAILGGAPVLVGHLLFGVLTFAGLSGAIPLTVQQLGFAFTFVTVIALILRYGSGGGS